MKKIILVIAAIAIIILGGFILAHQTTTYSTIHYDSKILNNISEDGHYDSEVDVAAYIHKYHKLPENYKNKTEAKSLGWSGGSLDSYLKGYAIGGDTFTNRQHILPTGHKYVECDVNTIGEDSRGAKRIVYSTDEFKIYYTSDHYSSFKEIIFD